MPTNKSTIQRVAVVVMLLLMFEIFWHPTLHCQTLSLGSYHLYEEAVRGEKLTRQVTVLRDRAHRAASADISSVILRRGDQLVIISQRIDNSDRRIKIRGVYTDVQREAYGRAKDRGCEPLNFLGKVDPWSLAYAKQGVRTAIMCSISDPKTNDSIGVLALGYTDPSERTFEEVFTQMAPFRVQLFNLLNTQVSSRE